MICIIYNIYSCHTRWIRESELHIKYVHLISFDCFSTILFIFSIKVYAVTSNAGEIALLFGVTVLVFLVQEDFSLAGSFADFLRSSNVAFLSPEVSVDEFKQPAKDASIVV